MSPETIDAMLVAGASAEVLAAAWKSEIAANAKVATARRAKDAERQRRKRGHAVSRGVTRTDADTAPDVSPKDNNQTPSLPPVEVSEPRGSSPQPRAWALPAGVSLQVWQDFLKNRKRKSLPNTDTAWKTFGDDLKRISSQTGIPPPELIQRCAGKGWASINDPREENDRRTNGLGRNQPAADGLSSTARAALQVFGPG